MKQYGTLAAGTVFLGILCASRPAGAVGCPIIADTCQGANSSQSVISGVITTAGTGVYGESPDAAGNGVYGHNTSATTGYGVLAIADGSGGYGVVGEGNGTSGTGVYGYGASYGVYAYSSGSGGYGVYAQASNSAYYAVRAVIDSTDNASGSAVFATAASGTGLAQYAVYGAISPYGKGYAVYGDNNSGASGAWAGYFNGSVNATVSLSAAGLCRFGCTSDIRLKKNVQPLVGALDQLTRLRPVTFEWKDPQERGYPTGVQRGLIAQEVEKVLPDWVGVNDQGFKTVDKKGLDVMLVQAIQTLKLQNDSLRDRVSALEGRRVASAAALGGGGLWGLAGAILGGALALFGLKRFGARA